MYHRNCDFIRAGSLWTVWSFYPFDFCNLRRKYITTISYTAWPCQMYTSMQFFVLYDSPSHCFYGLDPQLKHIMYAGLMYKSGQTVFITTLIYAMFYIWHYSITSMQGLFLDLLVTNVKIFKGSGRWGVNGYWDLMTRLY